MPQSRFKALETVLNRTAVAVNPPSTKISDFYAVNVFDKVKMKNYVGITILM